MNFNQNSESHDWKVLRLCRALSFVALIAILATGAAYAQVPADIEAKLLKIGPIVDPACTAKIYWADAAAEVAHQYLEWKNEQPSN